MFKYYYNSNNFEHFIKFYSAPMNIYYVKIYNYNASISFKSDPNSIFTFKNLVDNI